MAASHNEAPPQRLEWQEVTLHLAPRQVRNSINGVLSGLVIAIHET